MKSERSTDVRNANSSTLSHPLVKSAAKAGSNSQLTKRNCRIFPLRCGRTVKGCPPATSPRRRPVPYARKIPPHPNRRSPPDERPERRSIHRPPQPSKPHFVVVPGQEPYPIQHRHILPVARSLADWRPPIIRGKLQRRA